MADIAFEFTEKGWDIALDSGDIKTDAGLETAVAISLLTDARQMDARALAEFERDAGGWWGDSTLERPGDFIGSLMWTAQGKNSRFEQERFKQFAADALAWLQIDGVASAVNVTFAEQPKRFADCTLAVEIVQSGEQKNWLFWANWEKQMGGIYGVE